MRLRIALLLTTLALAAAASPVAAEGRWVCPPCGGACDRAVHAAPGECEHCGMRLIREEDADVRRVAILVFDGVQIIDYAGPYEVFGQAGYRVFTVSRDGATLTTAMGMSMNPAHSFENAPAAEILVVPGGDVDATWADERVLDWVRGAAARAEHVMSVCNGAFILARAGLLDGKTATTFYGLIDELREFAPAVEVVSDRRFVDNGKVVTTAGLSSGIDGSLHVVAEARGLGRAQATALHMEYDWDPGSGFARAALADRLLPALGAPPGATRRLRRTEGDRDRWTIDWTVSGDGLDVETVASHLSTTLRADAGWDLVARPDARDARTMRWRFRDPAGAAWLATTRVDREADDAVAVSLRLERSPARRASGGAP